MSIAVADYDRDGFVDVYLSVYSYYYGAGEAKAGTPTPYYDAVNGPPNVLFRNRGDGTFEDVTHEAGLDAGNDRYSFSAAWGDYDGDGWPDLVVANDFGRKNLYHNLGRRDGKVTFEDVAAKAGVEDYAAGMSVFFFDYDGDGRPDIYGGQMWSDNGLRVTASRDFMPDAPEDVRALYRHHARGNSLFRNRGDGTFEDVSLAGPGQHGPLVLVDGRHRLRQRRVGRRLRRERHGDPGREHARPGLDVLGRRRGALAAHAGHRHALRLRLAGDQSAHGRALGRRPPAARVPAQRRPGRLRRRLGRARARPRAGRTGLLRPRHRRGRRPGPRPARAAVRSPAPDLPERLPGPRRDPRRPSRRDHEQPGRDRRAGDRGDGSPPPDEGGAGGLRLPLAALEGAALRPRRQPAGRPPHASSGRAAGHRPSPTFR